MNGNRVEIRYVSRRGGSLTLNIPSELAKRMGLVPGCAVVFQYDEGSDRILIEKVRSVNTYAGRKIAISSSKHE